MINPFDIEERTAYRDTLRKSVAPEIKPYADEWEEEGDFPWDPHEKVGTLGYFDFGIDEAHSGKGFDDCFARMACAVKLAKCGARGVPAGPGGWMISLDPIQRLASEEIRQRVLPDIIASRKGSCLGTTEPLGGFDVANMQPKAHRDGDHWRGLRGNHAGRRRPANGPMSSGGSQKLSIKPRLTVRAKEKI